MKRRVDTRILVAHIATEPTVIGDLNLMPGDRMVYADRLVSCDIAPVSFRKWLSVAIFGGTLVTDATVTIGLDVLVPR